MKNSQRREIIEDYIFICECVDRKPSTSELKNKVRKNEGRFKEHLKEYGDISEFRYI